MKLAYTMATPELKTQPMSPSLMFEGDLFHQTMEERSLLVGSIDG